MIYPAVAKCWDRSCYHVIYEAGMCVPHVYWRVLEMLQGFRQTLDNMNKQTKVRETVLCCSECIEWKKRVSRPLVVLSPCLAQSRLPVWTWNAKMCGHWKKEALVKCAGVLCMHRCGEIDGHAITTYLQLELIIVPAIHGLWPLSSETETRCASVDWSQGFRC